MNFFRNDQISFLGSFKDKDLELSFQKKIFDEIHNLIAPCIFILLSIYLLFSLPDLLFSNIHCFITDVVIRLITIVGFFITYCFLGRFKNHHSYLQITTLVEFSFFISYFVMLYQFVNLDFTLNCMSVIIFITLFFILPNKWANSFFSSLVFISSFVLFCVFNADHFTENRNFLAGAVYVAIIFALNAFNSYRFNFSKRMQFYDNKMLHNLLNTDTLTGAFTRVKFNEEITKQIALSQQTDRKMSLAIFDIDNFKRINDTYGHLEGDNVLSGIANIVNENIRPRDILTRWGGEEFVVVFPQTGLASAVRTSERLRAMISTAKFKIDESVTCSFGVTEYKKGDTPISLLRRADKLLYDAKLSGKNAVSSI